MDDLNSGLPTFTPFSPEPEVNLKGKGLPWPVYLAIGLVVAAGLAFLIFRSYQNRELRKVHVAFMERFADFERDDANAFWKCLFGKDGDPRRFNQPEQVNAQLDGMLFADPKSFPQKVQDDCVPKALKASQKAKDLNPPPEYTTALDGYAKALAGMANAFGTWAEGAPKRFEIRKQEETIRNAGGSWSSADPRKPDAQALQFDKFMRCALPDLDSLKDGQALLEVLARKCTQGKDHGLDTEFLNHLRDKCIPEAQEAPAKAPAAFKNTLARFAADYDRESQAWEFCIKKMKREAKKEGATSVGGAWAAVVNASTEVRKIGKEALQDDTAQHAAPGPAPGK